MQEVLLEKIWNEKEEIQLQIVKDLLGIRGRRSKDLIKIGDDEFWKTIMPVELLIHLKHQKVLKSIKKEQFRVVKIVK